MTFSTSGGRPIAAALLLGALLTIIGTDGTLSSAAGAADGPAQGDGTPGGDGSRTTYLLRYKFQEGEVIRWTIEHLATTETRVSGNLETSRSRSVSTKRWEVLSVDPHGFATFVHSVEEVDMSNKVSDRPEVRYNSRTDREPPLEYTGIDQTIGVPLATFRVSVQGEVVERLSDFPPQDLGMGDIVIPLPQGPVEIGHTWDSRLTLTARESDGTPRPVNTRQEYRLDSVQTGIAYIKVRTIILTPGLSPRVRSQVMQQMTFGTILFDLEAGRVRKQEIDWDEEVIGFDTPDSLMKYNARYTETLLTGDQAATQDVATRPADARPSRSTARQGIRLREDGPLIRR